MLQEKNLSVLGSNLLFKGLDESAFSTLFNPKNFRAEKEGKLIFQGGDESEWLYLILQGEVKLKYSGVKGINSSFRRVKNEFFGEKELMETTNRITSAIADTDCILYLISREELFQLSRKHKIILSNLSLTEEELLVADELFLEDAADTPAENNEEIIIDEVPVDLNSEMPANEELHDPREQNYLFNADSENDDVNFNSNGFDPEENQYDVKPVHDSLEDLIQNNIFNEELTDFSGEYSDSNNNSSEEELISSINDFDHIPAEPEKFEFSTNNSVSLDKTYNDSFQTETLSLIEGTAKFINYNILFPLNEIKKHSAWLADNSKSEESLKVNEIIIKQTESINSLIETAFDFLSGKNSIIPKQHNVSKLMNDILELLSEYVETRNVKLYKKIESEVIINADEAKLYNAFLQIAKNACDSMPDGGNIFVSITNENHNVKIEFIDEGLGIPFSLIMEVFEPLVSHGKQDAAGLGLSITKKIIQDHNGEINIDGEIGEGTKVIISLPVV